MKYVDLVDAPIEWQNLLRVWRNSDRVRREMSNQDEISPEQHSKWLEKATALGSLDKVRVAVSDDGVPFGAIRLMDINRDEASADWGIYIGNENFLGRGFGKKMLADILEWAFREEGLKELHTMVRKQNVMALEMYQTVGFQIEGERGEFWEIRRYDEEVAKFA